MAEGSSVNSPTSDIDPGPDLSADIEFLGSEVLNVKSYEQMPGTCESILGSDPDRLLHLVTESKDMSTNPTEAGKGASSHQSYKTFGPEFATFDEGNIKPSFYKYIRMDERGLIQLDIEKLERKVWSLSLDETTEADPSQKENNVQILKDSITEFYKRLEDDEISSQQTEQGKSINPEKKKTEKLTKFEYEKKNKLWDRKPHLRLMYKEFSQRKFGEVNFTEEGLENFSKGLLNYVESDLHRAVNILRRIAYPKLCEKHFAPEFPTGAFAEEDEPVENISINIDHFEFWHKDLTLDFLELFEGEDIDSVAFDLEKNPKINNILPSFEKFLKSDNHFQFPHECFTIILAILKNPYRKFEFFYDDKLPVVKEQTAIAEYLVNCLLCPNILDDKVVSEKLAETIIRFANIHPSFLAKILAGFIDLLSNQAHNNHTYQIYCQVLNIMTSIGATIISLCLPQHFKRISCLAANDQNCELYFHLLRACEILIADTIENESQVEAEFSDENDLDLFYSDCYNYFGSALTNRLIPVFRKYEKRKEREEQYLSKKHAIFPTKDGYMDLEMWFLTSRNKHKEESESSNFPRVKECSFNSAGKVLCSSNAQLGYIIQEDMFELSDDDLEYWNSIDNFPESYLEGITDILTKNY